MLAEALRLVSLDNQGTRVPPHIETAVMQAWDARALGGAERCQGRSRLWLAAISTAACGVLVVTLWMHRAGENVATGLAPLNVEQKRTTTESQAYSLDAVTATEVLLEDPASLQLVRLTIQPSMLSAFGYALADPMSTEPVNVEMLIGLDGVPRAIRPLEISSVLEY